MNLKYSFLPFFLSLSLLLSGCNLIKTVKQSGKSELRQKRFLEDIPFDYVRNEIVIKGKFSRGDLEKTYILDTGAPTVISLESYKANRFPALTFFPDIASAMHHDSVANKNVLTLFPMLPEMHLGNLFFKEVGAYVINEKGLEKFSCFAPDGIIGSNLMNDAIWQIDYARQVLTVTDNLKKLNNIEGASEVKFKASGPTKKPIIPIKLNGKKYWFLFDTGSSFDITFSPGLLQFFEGISSDHVSGFSTREVGTVYSENDNKPLIGSYINLPEFALGNLKAKNINATVLELPFFEKRGFAKKQSGNLGNKFFQNYIVTINWKNNTIYFAPQPNPVKPDISAHFGFSGRFNAEKKYVVQVLFTGSEAEKAGIKLNDEIIAVNGISLENLAAGRYCEISNNPEILIPDTSDNATFTIRHTNGENKTYTFQRQPLFPEYSGATSIR